MLMVSNEPNNNKIPYFNTQINKNKSRSLSPIGNVTDLWLATGRYSGLSQTTSDGGWRFPEFLSVPPGKCQHGTSAKALAATLPQYLETLADKKI